MLTHLDNSGGAWEAKESQAGVSGLLQDDVQSVPCPQQTLAHNHSYSTSNQLHFRL